MNNFQLQVRGYRDNIGVERVRPVFVWKAPVKYKQFTIEMARDEQFKDIIFLRDTHECFCAYDSAMLKAETVYYIRVRSGMGEWSQSFFATEALKIGRAHV